MLHWVGSVVACTALLEVPAPLLREKMTKVVSKSRKHSLGAFHPSFDIAVILREELASFLPSDAASTVTGRLTVSLTKPNFNNVLVNEFASNEELLDALACSCFIPLFSGNMALYFRGKPYLDGGLTNNLPIIDRETITVSPFAGKTKNIAPIDDVDNKLTKISREQVEMSTQNLDRLIRALRVSTEKQLDSDFKQGFKHAELFLKTKFSKN